MTKIMKTVSFIVLGLGLLVSIYLGVRTRSFLTFIIYVAGTFLCCLQWLVMVEISEKIDHISRKLHRSEKSTLRADEYRNNGGSRYADSDPDPDILPLPAASFNGKWICPVCGEVNPTSMRTCKSCAHVR